MIHSNTIILNLFNIVYQNYHKLQFTNQNVTYDFKGLYNHFHMRVKTHTFIIIRYNMCYV